MKKEKLIENLLHELETKKMENGKTIGEYIGYSKLKEFINSNKKKISENILQLNEVLTKNIKDIIEMIDNDEDLIININERLIEIGKIIEITAYKDDEPLKKSKKIYLLSDEDEVQILTKNVEAKKINNEEYNIEISYINSWYNTETKNEVYNKIIKDNITERKPERLDEKRFILSAELPRITSISLLLTK